MKRLYLLVGLILVISLGAAAVACGGDDEAAEKAAEKILEEAAKEAGSEDTDVDIDISGELPDDFPEEFPIYEGAKLVTSFRMSSADTGSGYTVEWETGDAAQKVVDFYSKALSKDPWSITSTMTSGDGATILFSGNVGDTPFDGWLTIGATGEGKTSIALLGGEDTSGRLPESKDLPADFPSDVPMYDGATVLEAGKSTSGGYTTFDVTAAAEGTPSEIGAFYVDQLESAGWTIDSTSESSDDAQVSASKGETRVDIYVSASYQYEGYQEISINVEVSGE